LKRSEYVIAFLPDLPLVVDVLLLAVLVAILFYGGVESSTSFVDWFADSSRTGSKEPRSALRPIQNPTAVATR
jgi:hypothetical protein